MANPRPMDSMHFPRHSGIATFLRLPHITDPKELDIAIVGIPFDGSSGYRPSAGWRPGRSETCRQLSDLTTMRFR